jgi:hypothetical protein
MKYLTRREDFLRSAKTNEAKQDFLRNNRFTGMQAINEAGGPLSNDLGWGDSLLGRLINSFIRKAKIGYNATKVEPLLNAFRSQLDILIASSLSRDTKNELNQLRIKSYLSELRNICTDDISETEKLDELIGGHEDLWDPRRQDGGLWSNVLTQGVLVDTHDFIENEIDKKDLEKAGIPRDSLLDQLSIFIDNLRRLTVSDRDPVIETDEQNAITFVTNFTNVVNGISVMSERNNMQYDNLITDFGKFVIERDEKYVAEELRMIGTGSGTSSVPAALKGGAVPANVGKAVAKTKVGEHEDAKLLDSGWKKGEEQKKGYERKVDIEDAVIIDDSTDNAEKTKTAAKAVPNELGADSKSRWAKIKQLALKCVDKKFEDTEAILKNTDCVALIKSLASLTSTDLEYAMTKNIGKKIKIDDVEMPMDNAIEALVQKKDIEKLVSGVKVSGVRIKDSSKQIASNTKYTKDQKREILLKRLNRYKNKLAKKSNDEFSKTKIKELDVYLKQIGEGFTYPTGYERIYEEASGTASSVLDCWNNFVRGAEIKKDFLQITQREHDRLNGLLNGIDSEKTVLEYNLSENPDPIIAITRIFKRAHDLYYNNIIPSGRSGGAVSNKTFGEYEKLGGGASSQTTQENPGVGPWAVISIRSKWTDGVTEILENQKYREILANIRFVVPGSEDTFNRATEQAIMKWNNFIKIFEEAEPEDDKGKKSHGQILFDFITDMLNDETAASFDKQRRILMKKYFGFKDDAISNVEKKDKNIPAPDKLPKTEDTVPNSMFWAKTEDFKSFGTSKYEGPFYAIPIQTTNDHRMLFLHLLKNIELKDKSGNVSNGYLIKYTFDQPAIMEKFIEEKHPGYKIETDWTTSTASLKNIFYGIIKAFPKGKFKVTYLTTSNAASSQEFEVFNGYDMDIKSKKVIVFPAHLMMTDDKGKTSMIKTDFSTEVFSEKSNHAMLTDDILNKLKAEATK